MVTFTSRARLIKPAASGEVVDISQINANMDKIDANLGVFYCTSTTRPTDPFPGQVIRETDTGRTYIRSSGNGSWVMSQYQGVIVDYEPGYTGVISATSTYQAIHRFYFGTAGSDADLLIQGVFAIQAQATGSGVNSVESVMAISDNTGNIGSGDTIIEYQTNRTSDTSLVTDYLPFNYMLPRNESRRYIKFGARRTNVSTNWVDSAGISISMMVQPVSDTDINTLVPGYVQQL